MNEQEKSVALVGPQSEYNPRGIAPSRAETEAVCAEMAEMERKFQEKFKKFCAERGL